MPESEIEKLSQAIESFEKQQQEFGLDLAAQIRELQERLEKAKKSGPAAKPKRSGKASQTGSGGTATSGGVAAGERGIAIGGHVFGSVYMTPPGKPALTEEEFRRIFTEYLRWVQDAHKTARLYGVESLAASKGRPVRELSKVFVPLGLRGYLPAKGRKGADGRKASKAIGLARTQLGAGEEREVRDVALSQLLTAAERIAIIGGAGSGKSTIAAYLAAQLAGFCLGECELSVKLPQGRKALVPVVIPLRYLREYTRACSESREERVRNPRAGTLAGFIPWYLKRRSPALEMSEDFFDRLLKGKGCLLMLDGLDEVASREMRGQVRQQVEEMVNEVYPGNLLLVTAREAGYREDAVFGDDFLRLDVQPLDEEQIHSLVANWCREIYPGEAGKRTDELMASIRDINNLRTDRDLRPLVNTPLMTTMVVSVKWGETELPRERAKLYEVCVKVILQGQYLRDDPARKEVAEWGGAWEEQRDWLSRLALALQEGGKGAAAANEEGVRQVLAPELSNEALKQFIEAVRYRGGLLEEKAEQFQFLHLTFQEFLAARWLAKTRDQAFQHLQPHLANDWWREVLLLVHGFAQADYPPFAKVYLEWLSGQSGGVRLAALELAGAALLDLEKPVADVIRHQAALLAGALADARVPAAPVQRARAGDTLARLGDPRFRADAWFLPDEPLLGFVEVKAGDFLMGSNPRVDSAAFEEEFDQHKVHLPRYYISKYPVTVAQFQAFVGESGREPEDAGCLKGLANHPVVSVTWYEGLKYCEWLTERLKDWNGTPEPLAGLIREQGWQVLLPSEAEWEKAARGSDGQIYPWAGEFESHRLNSWETGIRDTTAVGSFPSGISPCGCLDMAGNVWEWTRSLWGKGNEPDFKYPYKRDERENLKASRDVRRVLRGGSFDGNRQFVRCPFRGWYNPDNRNDSIGFRVVVLPSSDSGL